MDDVRKRFKAEGVYFQKGYFDAYNNPNRTRQEMPAKKERINQLLIDGKLSKQSSDFFDGQVRALEDHKNGV
jgi:hypothetical protein